MQIVNCFYKLYKNVSGTGFNRGDKLAVSGASGQLIRRGSAASGWASLLAYTRCRLHSLVVRREAPYGQRMVIRGDCRGREASSTTSDCIVS